MTHTDYIKLMLNIKDNNVYFYDDFLKIVNINGKKTKVFRAFLTYIPDHCYRCGHINRGWDDVINWGFKRNCKIKITKVCGYDSLLVLDKQRYKCKHCNLTFVAKTNVVDFHKQISNDTNLNIKLELMQKSTEKDIARRNNVSTNHVNRILDSISEDTLIKNNGFLPTILGIDEFKATKDTKSKMAFIIVDQVHANIFDINNSRLSKDIQNYFNRYSKKERDKVKYITLDLYKPYYKILKKIFRNAILIPDRFHIVLQVRDALDNTRIKLCIKSNPNYKKLKKYWKLILKNEDDLSDQKRYSKCFRKEISQTQIVTYLINTDKQFYETYQIYQGILKAIDTRDKKKFLNIIHHHSDNISPYMKKALRTFRNMEKYIVNSFDYEYSNGITEGMNNLIKQIKHSACGYRKFKHLKARVMLIKGLLNPIKAQ